MRNRRNALLLSVAVHLVLISIASLLFDTVRACGRLPPVRFCSQGRRFGDDIAAIKIEVREPAIDDVVCEFGAVIHLESRWRGWRRDFTEKSLNRHVRYAETRGESP